MAPDCVEESVSNINAKMEESISTMNKEFQNWSSYCSKFSTDKIKELKLFVKALTNEKRIKRRKLENAPQGSVAIMPSIQESVPLTAPFKQPTPVRAAADEATLEESNEVGNMNSIRRSKRAAAKKAIEKNATAVKISLNKKLRRPTEVPRGAKITMLNDDSSDDSAHKKIGSTASKASSKESKHSSIHSSTSTKNDGALNNEVELVESAEEEHVVTLGFKGNDDISKRTTAGILDKCSPRLESPKDNNNYLRNNSGKSTYSNVSGNNNIDPAVAPTAIGENSKSDKSLDEKHSQTNGRGGKEDGKTRDWQNEETKKILGVVGNATMHDAPTIYDDLKSPVVKKGKKTDEPVGSPKFLLPIIVIDECPTISEPPCPQAVGVKPDCTPETKQSDILDVVAPKGTLVEVVASPTRNNGEGDDASNITQYNMRTRSKVVKLNHDSNDNETPRTSLKPQTIVKHLNSGIPVTKNKVREMVKTVEENILANTPKPLEAMKNKFIINDGKENSRLKYLNGSCYEKNRKITPLATNNRIFGAAIATKPCTIVVNSKEQLLKEAEEAEKKRKEEEQQQKLKKKEEALRKREEKLKINREKLRRKREEKMKKVCRTREAAEREKLEQFAKLEKEREERDQLIKAEIQRQKEEQIMKKKQLNLLKAQEAEERRQKEESARLAKLKEAEEEQRRLAELKMKQQEEAEKRLQQRQAEEQRAKEALKASQEKAAKLKIMNAQTYEMTPPRNEREPLPLTNPNDYGIDDVSPDDSSDDENHPKKEIPLWAQKPLRGNRLKVQSYLSMELIESFMKPPKYTPDLIEVFGRMTKKRVRTSSAVWTHCPRYES